MSFEDETASTSFPFIDDNCHVHKNDPSKISLRISSLGNGEV